MKRHIISLLMMSFLLGMGLASATRQGYIGGAVQEFATGAVLLTTGDTLHGPIKLYRELDMVSLTGPNQATRAFTASQITLFAVQDTRVGSELREPSVVVPAQPALPPARLPTVGGRPYYRPFGSTVNVWERVATSLAAERQAAHRPAQSAVAAVRLFRTLLWNHDESNAQLPTPAFFEQLTNGPYLLLRRQRLEFTAVTVDQSGSPALPVLIDHLYVADSLGKVTRLAQPKRDLLKLLGPRGPALQAYASQHQLRFDNAAQLGMLVTYANANLVARR